MTWEMLSALIVIVGTLVSTREAYPRPDPA